MLSLSWALVVLINFKKFVKLTGDLKARRYYLPLPTIVELLHNICYFVGINIVKKALKIPCYQIASNAGVDANEIVNRVLGEKAEVGYDALNGEFVDMISAGIIDPTKVRTGT